MVPMKASFCCVSLTLIWSTCRFLGYVTLMAGLYACAETIAFRPLIVGADLLRQPRTLILYACHDSSLVLGAVACSLSLLFTSIALSGRNPKVRAMRIFRICDLLTVFVASAGVAFLASLLCFLMIIGSY